MEKLISKDGTAIAFDQSGQGPALIFVDGALVDRSVGLPFAALLDPHFTVYRYDRRGRGDSGDTAPYAVEREVEDLAAVIAAVGGSAFVLGISSGAVLALTAAERGLSITKLALYEPPLIVDNTRQPVPRDYVAHLNALVAAGHRGEAVEYFLTAAVEVPAKYIPSMRASPDWPAMEKVAHTIAYDGAIMGDMMFGNPLPAKRWDAVTLPTLVMDGGASPAWMRNGVQSLAALLPAAQHRTLEGQTHAVAPEALAPVLVEFFLS